RTRAWWGREHRDFRVQMHLRMRYTTAIVRERYGTIDPDPPFLQYPCPAVLPRSSRMALLQPRADRAHVWQGDAPQRKCLSAMYDEHERGSVYAVSETVSVLRTTPSRGVLGVRREQRVRFCRKVQCLGQNPKIGCQKCNDLQPAKLS